MFLVDASMPLGSVVKTERGAASKFRSEFYGLWFLYAVEIGGSSLKQRDRCQLEDERDSRRHGAWRWLGNQPAMKSVDSLCLVVKKWQNNALATTKKSDTSRKSSDILVYLWRSFLSIRRTPNPHDDCVGIYPLCLLSFKTATLTVNLPFFRRSFCLE